MFRTTFSRRLTLVAAFLVALSAQAQKSADAIGDQAASLQGILKYDAPPVVAAERRSCVSGQQPASTQKFRDRGIGQLADSPETCVTVVIRMAQDGNLLQPYQELLTNLTGSSTGYEKLPAAIGTTVLKLGSNHIPVGNGATATLTAAWSFDAGLSVAYQQRPPAPNSIPNIATLKPIAERCLAQQVADLGMCYSTGYMYGIRAVNGMAIVAP